MMPDSKNHKLKVRSKVWLELEGKPFFGEGRLEILRAIDRLGSITKAAEETRISYRRIRGIIREMKENFGRPLVITQRGGRSGGWAAITTSAQDLISRFEKQQIGVKKEINDTFELLFNDFP